MARPSQICAHSALSRAKPNCTRAWIGAAIALSLSAFACGGKKTVDHGSLTLVVQGPSDGAGGTINPLTEPGVTTLTVEIDDGTGQLDLESFDVTQPIEIDHAPMGTGRVFILTTLDGGGNPVRTGQSNPVDLVEGAHVIVTVVMN